MESNSANWCNRKYVTSLGGRARPRHDCDAYALVPLRIRTSLELEFLLSRLDISGRPNLVNALLLILTLFLFILLAEFVLFRYFLRAPDLPTLDFVNGIVKYAPNQNGVSRVKNQIETEYNINANGWNSIYERYSKQKPPDKYRIAVIGDSYVQAFEVNFHESVAEQLEAKLGRDIFQVYRFGISGAPLSQYLHMLRREVLPYSPDMIIILMVHNDFAESHQNKPGVYTSSFLRLAIQDGVVAYEVQPHRLQRRWYEPIRHYSATWRFLAYRQKIRFDFLRSLILGPEKARTRYQANIPVSSIEFNQVNNEIATDYVFGELKRETDSRDIKLLVFMDGYRKSIYEKHERHVRDERELYATGALSLNSLAKSAALSHGIHFLDLHPVFESTFANTRKKFNVESDNHWNVYGHQVVAHTIFEYLNTHRLTLARTAKGNTGLARRF